jgi:hypothetical protein
VIVAPELSLGYDIEQLSEVRSFRDAALTLEEGHQELMDVF